MKSNFSHKIQIKKNFPPTHTFITWDIMYFQKLQYILIYEHCKIGLKLNICSTYIYNNNFSNLISFSNIIEYYSIFSMAFELSCVFIVYFFSIAISDLKIILHFCIIDSSPVYPLAGQNILIWTLPNNDISMF